MENTTRLTVAMTREEHKYLKRISEELGMTMKEFVLLAAFEKIGEIKKIERYASLALMMSYSVKSVVA